MSTKQQQEKASKASIKVIKKEKAEYSFHRRVLPPPSISLSSPPGTTLFTSSLLSSGCLRFFTLISHFSTQDSPAYCGLSTLTIILNALNVDPRKQWKGSVWRYYHENMLNCCKDLEKVKEEGITFETFCCLVRCQGLRIEKRYADTFEGNFDELTNEFRKSVIDTCCNASEEKYLAVSYSRKHLSQTGDGHFSPVGAYDSKTDKILILDTARFKYQPHWVDLKVICEAMLLVDKETGRSRGYAVLSMKEDSGIVVSKLLTAEVHEEEWRKKVEWLKKLKGEVEKIQFIEENGGVLNFFQPTVAPVRSSEKEEISKLIASLEKTSAFLDAEGVAVSKEGDRCCDAAQNLIELGVRHVVALFLLAVRGGEEGEEVDKDLMEEVEATKKVLDCTHCEECGDL
ncbi:hypothetical protein TrST_g5019 [Triparma strigata]|uniref:glutathione gamma-glutamylcysteinyltransferase n=2 Tax=Triparma strigata TaxID=1606541 RepID=A0A9W7C7P2_9STRA|nr:hypothetical protein TrST_g5019 [Triparma strigata]